MILDEIIKSKKKEIASIKECFSPSAVNKSIANLPPTRDFKAAITSKKLTLIAEVKKASPSAGVIMEHYHPEEVAAQYLEAGASAISVLTEQKNFMGFITDIKKVSERVNLPILRKDFIIDESQIYHSRISCADAVLLIVRILDRKTLKRFLKVSKEVSLHSVVEAHTADEAKMAIDQGAEIIGINNRDLDTLAVDIRNTENVLKKVPELKKRIIVSESGIVSAGDVRYLSGMGVRSVLVGEAILKSGDIKAKIRELLGT